MVTIEFITTSGKIVACPESKNENELLHESIKYVLERLRNNYPVIAGGSIILPQYIVNINFYKDENYINISDYLTK